MPKGVHAGMDGIFKLMAFEGAPSMVYAQAIETGRLLDDPAVVTRCTPAYGASAWSSFIAAADERVGRQADNGAHG